MSLSYTEYRETGLTWLGQIPTHWKETRIGACFSERREKVSDKDFEPLSVTMGGIVPQIETAAKTDDGDNRKLVMAGDFVINSRSDRKGSSGLSALDGSVSLINTVLQPLAEVHPPFSHWLLKSAVFQEEFYRWGRGIVADLWTTKYSEMKRIPLALPPLAEQQAIAAFLDRETAKLDALVEEQRRLIALLKEKRQAVISHAVTKGLDPTAPLKPSGIDWLGDIPAHWEMKRVKHLVISQQGIQIGPFGGMLKDLPTEETGYKLYGQENTISGNFGKGSRWIEPKRYEELLSYELRSGDLVLTRKGSIGNCQIFPPDACPGIADSDTIRVRIDANVAVSEYVQGCFQDADFISTQLDLTKRGAILSGLNSSVVANLAFPLPPRDEQTQLLAFLTTEEAKFSALTAEATRAITLLQERRAALISAAVTGKIDVRDSGSDEEAA